MYHALVLCKAVPRQACGKLMLSLAVAKVRKKIGQQVSLCSYTEAG